MTWDTPIAETCPQCGSTMFKKAGKKGKIYCAKPGCGYEREAAETPEKNEDMDF